MVIQHNLTAMNSNRQLGVTTSAQSKSAEKLSSGYRINRAADDAAGLSISEKMRKQIRGLDQASTNAEDGVSAVQTAEGALTEVHSMLQRMNELATQAANGTNSESDRDAIQDEIDQLTTEIDRVAETTKFNETYLLKGNAEGTSSDVNVAAHDAGLAGKLTDLGNGTTTFALNKELKDGDAVTIAGKSYTIGTTGAGSVLDPSTLNASTDGYAISATVVAKELGVGDTVTYDGNTYTLTDTIGVDDLTWAAGNKFKVGEVEFTIAASGAATVSGTSGTIGLSDVSDYIKSALADGKQVTATDYKVTSQVPTAGGAAVAAASTTPIRIVEKLGDGEVSTAQVQKATAANVAQKGSGATAAITEFNAGDSVTIAGETTTVTAAEPASAKDVYDAISALTADGTNSVTIGTGTSAINYIIAAEGEEDADNYKLTVDSILAKIHDGDTVSYPGATNGVTVIGDIGSTETASDVITAKQAYAMMADELQKASSIGTDTAAKVSNDGNGKFTITQGTVEVKDSLIFNLHVGSDADMTNKINVEIDSMSAAGLGVKGLNVSDDTGVDATYAIDAIADAISKVSAQRSALGAAQNRLEHTIANLDNVVENTTSAESRIRDTDMAEEMVEYSKNNILAQAGQSMLAQANQSTQGVLSLLQ
jgi:flagellin-like hook-associated protein FlgL